MKILGIETSCDDTCASVISADKDKIKILSNIVSSQTKIHQKYGGVFPTLARREHEKNLVPVLTRALKEAKLLKENKIKISKQEIKTISNILKKGKHLPIEKFFKKYQKPNIDAIALTIGPGLEPCLWTGINFVKALSFFWKIPIIKVNHIEAHILVNFPSFKNFLPSVCLIVSGGHTQIILMKDIGNYKVLGETRDDAAGECFDKTARILGLEYPGGPAISKKAEKTKKGEISLPRPMIYQKNYDFSFSGLKTAVLYNAKENKVKSEEYVREMCREIQQSIIDVLIFKTMKAARNCKAKSIIIGGGVTANKELKKQFKLKAKEENIPLFCPEKNYCTDNATMIAVAGYLRKKQIKWNKVEAKANLRI